MIATATIPFLGSRRRVAVNFVTIPIDEQERKSWSNRNQQMNLSPNELTICRMLGHSAEAFAAAKKDPLEGKVLVFRGGNDMSGKPFEPGPAPGRAGAAPFPGKRASSPFKSMDTSKLKMTDDERKICQATGQDPAEYCAHRDGTDTDDDDDGFERGKNAPTIGVDGLPHMQHCVFPGRRRAQ